MLALAVIGSLAACKKTEPAGPTNAEKMITGKWRLTYSKSFMLLNGTVEDTFDVFATLDSCALDDLMDLRADHTHFMDQGDKMCLPFFPKEMRRGTWKLQNNDREIAFTLDSPAQVSSSRILELTTNRLELYKDSTYTAENGQVVSGKLISVYVK